MDLRRQLADVLRRMRHEAGLTQRDMARQLRISQAALARLENADLNTTLDTLTRLCRALHCDIGELFSGKVRLRSGR
jgi:transcriptional regulator with XRE-family HTH domain